MKSPEGSLNLIPAQYSGDFSLWADDITERERQAVALLNSVNRERILIRWSEEFYATLQRGGQADSDLLYSFHGIWRLAKNRDRGSENAFEPVVLDQELPPGVRPKIRRVISAAKLITAKCAHCEEDIPVTGRSSGEGTDTYAHDWAGPIIEIAVAHCRELQPQTFESFDRDRYGRPSFTYFTDGRQPGIYAD